MKTVSVSAPRDARIRGALARSAFDHRLRMGHRGPLLQVEVHRNESGVPYIDTLKGPTDMSQRVFLSEGASMLFWGVRTYRLVWLDY
jgi:hypothetical protein